MQLTLISQNLAKHTTPLRPFRWVFQQCFSTKLLLNGWYHVTVHILSPHLLPVKWQIYLRLALLFGSYCLMFKHRGSVWVCFHFDPDVDGYFCLDINNLHDLAWLVTVALSWWVVRYETPLGALIPPPAPKRTFLFQRSVFRFDLYWPAVAVVMHNINFKISDMKINLAWQKTEFGGKKISKLQKVPTSNPLQLPQKLCD